MSENNFTLFFVPLETSKVIVFAKITFRFKECMKRLSFRVNQFGDI